MSNTNTNQSTLELKKEIRFLLDALGHAEPFDFEKCAEAYTNEILALIQADRTQLIKRIEDEVIGEDELLHLEEWATDEDGLPKSNIDFEQKYKNMFRRARNELKATQRQLLANIKGEL